MQHILGDVVLCGSALQVTSPTVKWLQASVTQKMNNTRAGERERERRDDAAVHKASGSQTWVKSFMLDLLLHNIKSVDTERDESDIWGPIGAP